MKKKKNGTTQKKCNEKVYWIFNQIKLAVLDSKPETFSPLEIEMTRLFEMLKIY